MEYLNGEKEQRGTGAMSVSESAVQRLVKFRPSYFGEILDYPIPDDCDAVVICVDTYQHMPEVVCLPHQVYRAKLALILENNPGARSVTIIPYRNRDKVEVKVEEI
ncbi:MAG TPA: hypothetical protein DDY86_03870 [Syntrophaceae bacterium]|nr:hypothetical protein [Syntrophaceae bacterium]